MYSIVHPYHYQIYRRSGAAWYVKEGGRVFYNPTNTPTKLEHVERDFDLTEEQIVIELFRINGGKPGYYLANLRDRKYYYCGSKWEDIKTTLISLGIGRADPQQR
jgi:hypothetical protein